MKCYNVRPHLEKMAAGEIDGVLLRQLQGHLQTCPGCRGEYREMKQVLEIWRQAPRLEPAPQFSPAWRQRIRQEAFKKESGSRSFFTVFKGNTLIPALGVLVAFAVLGIFNFVNHRFFPKVVIEPEITRYSPALSSVIGLPLTVKLSGGKVPENIIYHWTTEYGRFLSSNGKATELGGDVRTQEDKVYWSVDFKDGKDSSGFGISLQVEEQKTGKVIAQADLRLEKDGEGFWVVKD